MTSESFSEFYGRLREPIERYVRYLFNLDPYDAEDVAAGSFENALRALPPGRIVQQPTDWMYQIARRKAIDFMRHRRAIPMQSLSAPTGDGITLADTLLGPDDDDSYAQMVDRRNVLAHIFKHLQPNYATAIRLYDHEGYSYQEIMRIMNVGYSNAKNIVSRGREQARLLAAEYLSGETLVRRRVRLSVD